jgi:molybdopterin synthase catalytic subunit
LRPDVSAAVTDAPLRPSEVLGAVGGEEDGAVILFLGTVRNHADGRPVRGLRYEAYEAMAQEVLGDIALEAAESTGVARLRVVHRTGDLEIGDVSVAIAVSSPHRDEAFRASRYVIEEIKKRLPVWKKEEYADGRSEWVRGMDPGSTARAGSGTGGLESEGEVGEA